ncbi:hypothetical protein ABPG75_007020 [Micractinium tetrahymenae]
MPAQEAAPQANRIITAPAPSAPAGGSAAAVSPAVQPPSPDVAAVGSAIESIHFSASTDGSAPPSADTIAPPEPSTATNSAPAFADPVAPPAAAANSTDDGSIKALIKRFPWHKFWVITGLQCPQCRAQMNAAAQCLPVFSSCQP